MPIKYVEVVIQSRAIGHIEACSSREFSSSNVTSGGCDGILC